MGFWQNLLNKAEKACDTTHSKCFAVLWSVPSLRPYLERSLFTNGSQRVLLDTKYDGGNRKSGEMAHTVVNVLL